MDLHGKELTEGGGWKFDADDQRLIIKTRDYRTSQHVIAWQ